MEKSYLNLSSSDDLQNKKDRFIYHSLESLPGLLSWGTLFLTFLLSWQLPIAAAIFIIIFDFFWLWRILYLSCHQVSSLRQMRKNLKIDWLKKLKEGRKDWQKVYHLIILPTFKEGIEVLEPTFQALVNSNYPKDKMIIVLATEERAGDLVKKNAKIIEEKFKDKFFQFLITLHPQNIKGEISGKGSNFFFALGKAKKEILDKLSLTADDVIVSIFDIDTRPYPDYFGCLTWHYLTSDNPLKSSYQPIPVYNNNVWQAPAFSRVVATSGTFWQMMQQERKEQLVSYSSHSLPLKVLLDVGYPNNVVSDDSRIFWKAYLFYDADYRVSPLYYPVSMDAVLAKNFKNTVSNQYKQQRRWAWGCENIPYLLFGFLKNKKIPLLEKLRHSFVILEGFWSWAMASFLIFFLGWLPLILGGSDFQANLFSYNLPRLTSRIMNLAMLGMVVSAVSSFLLLPPRPKNFPKWKNIFFILQWFLVPVVLIFFGAIPALESQTRLMLKKPLGFWVTEKSRKTP